MHKPWRTLLVCSAAAGGCAAARHEGTVKPSDRPAALVDGRPILWSELQPGLAELAGGEVLEEAVLDALLADRCRRSSIAITDESITSERTLLLRSLDPSPDRAEELLREVRAARRHGESRFNASLRRSAMLRALCPLQPAERDAELAQMLRIRRAPRSVVRIITTADEQDAAATRARAAHADGTSDPARFAAAAADPLHGDPLDQRAPLAEVSSADPSVPAALRDAVDRTKPGFVTPVVFTGKAFVVALVQERLPPRPQPGPGELQALTGEAGERVQRRAMERLARSMLADARVEPLSRELGWSWDQRRR